VSLTRTAPGINDGVTLDWSMAGFTASGLPNVALGGSRPRCRTSAVAPRDGRDARAGARRCEAAAGSRLSRRSPADPAGLEPFGSAVTYCFPPCRCSRAGARALRRRLGRAFG